jgi:hypothetical protein
VELSHVRRQVIRVSVGARAEGALELHLLQVHVLDMPHTRRLVLVRQAALVAREPPVVSTRHELVDLLEESRRACVSKMARKSKLTKTIVWPKAGKIIMTVCYNAISKSLRSLTAV